MKRIILMAALVLGLGITVSACANTQTRVMQGVLALDESFAVTQQLAEAVLETQVLTTDQRNAVKAGNHFIAEELKTLTDKAIAVEKGENVTLSSEDLNKAKDDLSTFKGVLATLKAAKPDAQASTTASQTK